MECKCGNCHEDSQDAELKAIMEELLNKDAEALGQEARAVAVDIVKSYNSMSDERRKTLTPEQITVVKEAIAVVSRQHALEPAEKSETKPETVRTAWADEQKLIDKTFKTSAYSIERSSYHTAKNVVDAYNALTDAQKNSLVSTDRETVELAIRVVAKGPPEKPEGPSVFQSNLGDELRGIFPNKTV